jgi:hypothetical protein
MHDYTINAPAQALEGVASLQNPVAYVAQATRLATSLAEVINKQKLFAVIQNRKYVTVEAWTLLANMLAVNPVVVWSRPVEDHEGSQGWEARVEVKNMQGVLIGSGEAMCTRSEKTWQRREDFALRAMAQTRATSRALRNPLGFVVKLAGYEATPAEEMPRDGEDPLVRRQNLTTDGMPRPL